MKYHKGECEVCEFARNFRVNHVTFLCFADTGRKWGDCDVVTKNVVAVRKCRYFKKKVLGETKK